MENKKGDVILSPEGVEERIEAEHIFRITLTQGGKLRIYQVVDGEPTSFELFDDIKEATEALGVIIMMFGGLLNDPKKTMDLLIKNLGEKPK